MLDVLSLPPGQLRTLVAIAACWRVCGRPPGSREHASDGFTLNSGHVNRLIINGYLTAEWRHGIRLRSTIKPSKEAWAQLDELSPERRVA